MGMPEQKKFAHGTNFGGKENSEAGEDEGADCLNEMAQLNVDNLEEDDLVVGHILSTPKSQHEWFVWIDIICPKFVYLHYRYKFQQSFCLTYITSKKCYSSFFTKLSQIIYNPNTLEDWRRTSIFQTLVCCDQETRKLIIDGGSSMNVVSESTVQRLKLPIEPHSESYKVACINNSSISVTRRCLLSIKHGFYSDSIECDVIPMTVSHTLLGRPWLYDRDVNHNGKFEHLFFQV